MSRRIAPAPRARSTRLAGRELVRFHAPLAANAMLLALAGPIVNLVLTRSGEPERDLAAFWIAFTVALFAQSACVALQPVTIALVSRRAAARPLLAAALIASGAASAALLALSLTAAGNWFFRDVIPCAGPVATRAREVLGVLALLPPLIALRSLAGGLAAARRDTHLIALTTAIRIGLLGLGAAVIVRLLPASGALAAAWLVALGVCADTLLLSAAVLGRSSLRVNPVRGARVAFADVARLALPLVIATLAWTATRGAVNAVLGALSGRALAQAAFGFLLPIVMVSCAPLWALLEVTLVLPRTRASFGRVLGFAALVSLAASAALAFATLTSLGQGWLLESFQLGPALRGVLLPTLGLAALAPPLVAARAIAQGLLMRARQTGVMLLSAPARFAVLLAVGFAAVRLWPQANGATLALSLLLTADAVEAVLLGLAAQRACRHAGGLEELLGDSRPARSRLPMALPAHAGGLELDAARSAA
jgi:hypothetical protein